jgi:TetR/AcrR family transcriptional regulator, mexJK operon transcriptional repressor
MPVSTARQPLPHASPKREVVLEAAGALFLGQGYAQTTMDQVAARAGVSKMTVYSHFGSKEGLFRAFVTGLCERLLAPLATPTLAAGPPEATLHDFAGRVVRAMLAPESVALFRRVVAETPRFPELGRAFWETGAKAAVDALADYLAEQGRRGTLRIDDPVLAARQLLAMTTAHLHTRALLGVELPAPEETRAIIDGAVATFCRAHRP